MGKRKRWRATELGGEGGPRLGQVLNALKTKQSSHQRVLNWEVTGSGGFWGIIRSDSEGQSHGHRLITARSLREFISGVGKTG